LLAPLPRCCDVKSALQTAAQISDPESRPVCDRSGIAATMSSKELPSAGRIRLSRMLPATSFPMPGMPDQGNDQPTKFDLV
jgi:hypothetical protein